MATESSFRDREARCNLLRDAVAGFVPAFNPPDASIGIAPFTVFLAKVNEENTRVETLEAEYTAPAAERADLTREIKLRATQALNRLKSNRAWAPNYKAAKLAADKLRGVRPRKSAPVPESASEESAKRRNQGEQAYAEVAALFGKFIAAAAAADGYETGAPVEIEEATMEAMRLQLVNLNNSLSQIDVQLTAARQKRKITYFGEEGLQKKTQSIKSAVKGQYGLRSAPWLAVKGIKW